MPIRKELAFFLVFAAFLGWGAWDMISGGSTQARRSRARGSSGDLQYESRPTPRADLALSGGRFGTLDRDLFTPPRDTAPLPLLPLEMPPVERLEVLAPPTAWGPEPRAMGAWLRRLPSVQSVPGLFELDELADASSTDEFEAGDGSDITEVEGEDLFEQIEVLKQQYDWIVEVNMKFGYIKNDDRFGLVGNDEPILFLEVDPSTGAPRFPGQLPIEYTRDRLTGGFGYAETPANKIEVRVRQFSNPLQPAEFERAVDFAEECIELRNDADRALEIAQDMFQRAADLGTDDVRARLGLARCFEMGFRFEEAFRVYEELVEGAGSTRPEVWARFATLLNRFRLFDRAEEAYLAAIARGRSSWEARLGYGSFLNQRARFDEAREQLQEAVLREPSDASLRGARVAIRSELARTHVALGDLDEARALYDRVRSADPSSDLGIAGTLALTAISGGEPAEDVGVDGPDASFDLLFARGLSAVYSGQWVEARRDLLAAVEADPFRAGFPLRTLSWMAEITGHPEEALTLIESALQAMPGDPWSLYHQGRLLAAADDVGGARANFLAALEYELDAPDVLVQLGSLAQDLGDHLAAERYYERALLLDPGRAVVHSMRGYNRLQLGDVEAAGGDFRAALDRDPDLASAGNGLAWWSYVTGDPVESLAALAELIDQRRNAPADDPHRAWAEAQKARIIDHRSKEVWTDRFDRVGRIGNGWDRDEGLGAGVRLNDGAVMIEGQLTTDGRTRLMRQLPADRFLGLEVDVMIGADSSNVIVGAFVSRETVTSRTGDVRVNAAIEVVRNAVDGVVQVRVVKGGESEASVTDLVTSSWAVGEPVRLRIEREGDSSTDTTITVWLDDVPVLERIPMQALGRSNQPVTFGVFVEGKSGRRVNVTIDDVRVVRRT